MCLSMKKGHPEAKVQDVAKAPTLSVSAANKGMIRVLAERLQNK